ncbi:MAG: hypothetical protein JWM32_22 [Verrucomicrobia bacterium]|nr:hypothetical protein [Verrucomicrobiota bacterium]
MVRGEIDNRTRGRVSGRIWLLDRPEPVELNLTGDAWRDLAGRRLEFVNPKPKPEGLGSFATKQDGTVGDLTASRKVRVLDIPREQFADYYKSGKEFPWHWGNSVYLEWYSKSNGRVVIESADYELTIIGEPFWEMTSREEETQRGQNSEEHGKFVERLTEAVAKTQAREEHAAKRAHPQTEAEAEVMMQRNEQLMDRVHARLQREGVEANFEKVIREEIGRQRREHGEAEPTREQIELGSELLEEVHRTMEDAGDDEPEDEKDDTIHPLAVRARDMANGILKDVRAAKWVPPQAGIEHPCADLVNSTIKAAIRLAGVLLGEEWPPEVEVCGLAIVRLKRVRGHFDDAEAAAQACAEQSLTNQEWLATVRVEIGECAGEIDAMIAEAKVILERGFD